MSSGSYEAMNEVRILKWVGLSIPLAMACVSTPYLGLYNFQIGAVVLVIGLARKYTVTGAARSGRGGTLIVCGGLLVLPPIAFLTVLLLGNGR